MGNREGRGRIVPCLLVCSPLGCLVNDILQTTTPDGRRSPRTMTTMTVNATNDSVDTDGICKHRMRLVLSLVLALVLAVEDMRCRPNSPLLFLPPSLSPRAKRENLSTSAASSVRPLSLSLSLPVSLSRLFVSTCTRLLSLSLPYSSLHPQPQPASSRLPPPLLLLIPIHQLINISSFDVTRWRP